MGIAAEPAQSRRAGEPERAGESWREPERAGGRERAGEPGSWQLTSPDQIQGLELARPTSSPSVHAGAHEEAGATDHKRDLEPGHQQDI